MASEDETTCTPPDKKKRRLIYETEEEETENDTPNSSSSCVTESDDSIKYRLPHDVSKWNEEHLTGLSFVTTYDSEIRPQDLLDRFPLKDHYQIQSSSRFTIKRREEIKRLLKKHDFNELNIQFKNLKKDDAAFLRKKNRYGANISLISPEVDTCLTLLFWFKSYEIFRVQFFEHLYRTIVKRDLAEKKGVNDKHLDPLCEYDFQFLFQTFASMCGLRTNTWSEPSLPTKHLQLSEVEISGKADVLFCNEIPDIPGSLQEILPIVAVCEVSNQEKFSNNGEEQRLFNMVKRLSFEKKEQSHVKTRGSESAVTSSTSSGSLPPHIPLSLLGQHGGELLLYHQQSIMKNNAVLGIIVQETKVTFTSLEMTPEQFEALKSGRTPSTKPKMTFTRSYDFMIKDDRHALFDPLLELSFRQCNE